MKIDKESWIAPGAVVLGDVNIEKDCSVWYNAVIRGDKGRITIKEGSNIQDNAVVHVGPGIDVNIGVNVSVGHSAIVHGCTIGDNTIVGMGAIVMNNAIVGKNCIIGAGSLVTQGKVIPDGSIVVGNPGKVVKQMTPENIKANLLNARSYIEETKEMLASEIG